MQKAMSIIIALFVITSLQGCAALFVAGAAGTTKVLHDRRNLSTQLDDTTLEFNIARALGESEALKKHAHLRIHVLNGKVLIVGQTPTPHLQSEAARIVRSLVSQSNFHNEIEVRDPTSVATRTQDSWISTKVHSSLIADETLDFSRIKVVTENKKVFLMGLVTRQEADMATEISRKVNGVREVVRVFEFVSG